MFLQNHVKISRAIDFVRDWLALDVNVGLEPIGIQLGRVNIHWKDVE